MLYKCKILNAVKWPFCHFITMCRYHFDMSIYRISEKKFTTKDKKSLKFVSFFDLLVYKLSNLPFLIR